MGWRRQDTQGLDARDGGRRNEGKASETACHHRSVKVGGREGRKQQEAVEARHYEYSARIQREARGPQRPRLPQKVDLAQQLQPRRFWACKTPAQGRESVFAARDELNKGGLGRDAGTRFQRGPNGRLAAQKFPCSASAAATGRRGLALSWHGGCRWA